MKARATAIAFVVMCAAFVIAHVLALYRESINWDELALLDRARHTLATGTLDAGGRPGLGVIVLLPFVDGCDTTMTTLHHARLVWSLFTFALLAGLFVLLLQLLRELPRRWHAAALGLALFALVPLFLRWSLHVRTDQPAIAAALWAGVLLLRSRERWRWSIAAGVLVGIGYLFSQKAIYVGALVVLLAIGDQFIARAIAWKRDAMRVAGLVVGAVLPIALYAILTPRFFVPPKGMSLERGMDLFAWYRSILHYKLYRTMWPTVVPHIVLLVALCACSVGALRTPTLHRRRLVVAMAVVASGIAVGWFHTAAFPYFWLAIGLFPAIAIAIGWHAIIELAPRIATPLTIAGCIAMIALAVLYRDETLEDTQAIQRDTYAFVDALPPSLRGFHPDGGLVCREDIDRFPVYLGQRIARDFTGSRAGEKTASFLAQFRSRPVAFVIQTPRIAAFPQAVRTFWDTHYVQYAGAVMLAGQRVSGAATVDILVPGRYRWIGDGPISIDGQRIADVVLAPGHHEVFGTGMLVLAVDADPTPSSAPFYGSRAVEELPGFRRRWW